MRVRRADATDEGTGALLVSDGSKTRLERSLKGNNALQVSVRETMVETVNRKSGRMKLNLKKPPRPQR